MPNSSAKLQQVIAHAGVTSRRKAEELITAGQVTVNNEPAHLGQRVEPSDQITVNGKPLPNSSQTQLYLIYKPVGIISTTEDELHRPTVIDFLKKNLPVSAKSKLPRLYPVGRLDQESEGLMLLTNDGSLTQQLTHPSYEVEKTYHVTVDGHPTSKALSHLERGVKLREGYTAPAKVKVLSEDPDTTELAITIHEGRNHQVRRMLERVGYEVTRLIRVKLGPYSVEDLNGKPVLQLR